MNSLAGSCLTTASATLRRDMRDKQHTYRAAMEAGVVVRTIRVEASVGCADLSISGKC